MNFRSYLGLDSNDAHAIPTSWWVAALVIGFLAGVATSLIGAPNWIALMVFVTVTVVGNLSHLLTRGNAQPRE